MGPSRNGTALFENNSGSHTISLRAARQTVWLWAVLVNSRKRRPRCSPGSSEQSRGQRQPCPGCPRPRALSTRSCCSPRAGYEGSGRPAALAASRQPEAGLSGQYSLRIQQQNWPKQALRIPTQRERSEALDTAARTFTTGACLLQDAVTTHSTILDSC